MANTPLVALHGVDFTLPGGAPLFQDLHETLAAETVALIGRNGSGKSTLGRLVSGELAPDAGRIERSVHVYRVAQQDGTPAHASLAQLAGLDAPLAALRRLASGDGLPGDIELVGERWDLEARWQALLAQAGLDESLLPAALSGGQRMLLALIGGFCNDAGLLVLDEPSNHLDRTHRALLEREIARWKEAQRGLLIITHDRALLDNVDRTLEIRPPRLHRYGGGWSTVEQQRTAELASATARLERARTERRRELADMRQQAERAARKNARGTRERHTGNQSRLLLDAMQDRAQRSSGALAERHAQRRDALDQEVSDSFAALGDGLARPEFPALAECTVHDGQASIVIEGLVAPWAWDQPFTWTARGPVRVAIRGPNGCGKTTLMKLIAGQLAPASGRCASTLACAVIDQTLAQLDPALPLLDQLSARSRGRLEGRLRQYLALAGIGADCLFRPVDTLSGGERMRGALLSAVLGEPPARMLLLDEPSNHLDLHATEALEAMLGSWTGALVVVSHDEAFLGKLRLTHSIERTAGGWRVSPALLNR